MDTATTTGDPYLLGSRYIWRKDLGADGTAAVHLGWDPVLERDVAVYLFTPAFLGEAGGRAQFLSDAARVEQLDHPAIREPLDHGIRDGNPYVVYAYRRGKSLAARLADGEMSEHERLRIWKQVRRALEHAHARGLVHGDLRPERVYIDRSGRAQLFGFGWPAPAWKIDPPSVSADLAALHALGQALAVLPASAAAAPTAEAENVPAPQPPSAPAMAPAPAGEMPRAVTVQSTDPAGDGYVSFEMLAGQPPVEKQPVALGLRPFRRTLAVVGLGLVGVIGVGAAALGTMFDDDPATPSSPPSPVERAVDMNRGIGATPVEQQVAGARQEGLTADVCANDGWRGFDLGDPPAPAFRDEQSCNFFFQRNSCPAPAAISNPAPGSRLEGDKVEFHWNAGCGVFLYQLMVDNETVLQETTAQTGRVFTVENLPTDGRPVTITLISSDRTTDNRWRHQVTYQSATPVASDAPLAPSPNNPTSSPTSTSPTPAPSPSP